jgi:hypothetical protein
MRFFPPRWFSRETELSSCMRCPAQNGQILGDTIAICQNTAITAGSHVIDDAGQHCQARVLSHFESALQLYRAVESVENFELFL